MPRLCGALRALAGVRVPLLQSSANLSGGPEARRLTDVPAAIRAGADLALDGGELGGTPSTVIDLREYAARGTWRVLREGALAARAVSERSERCAEVGIARPVLASAAAATGA